jgi:hypothetical protein
VVAAVGGDSGVPHPVLARGADAGDGAVRRPVRPVPASAPVREFGGRLDYVQPPQAVRGFEARALPVDSEDDRVVARALDEHRETVVERAGEAGRELAAGVRVEEGSGQRRLRDDGVGGVARREAGHRAERQEEDVAGAERIDVRRQFLVEVACADPLPADVPSAPGLRDRLAFGRPGGEVDSEEPRAAWHTHCLRYEWGRAKGSGPRIGRLRFRTGR